MLKKGLPGLFFLRSTTSRPIQKVQGSSQAESHSLVRTARIKFSHSWVPAPGKPRRLVCEPRPGSSVRSGPHEDDDAGAERRPQPLSPPTATSRRHRSREPRPRRPHSPLPAARNPQRGVRNPERTTRSTEPGTHSPQHRAELLPEDASHGLRSFRTIMSLQRTLLVSGFTGLLVADAGRDGGRAGLPPVWLRSMRHLVCACSAPAPPCAGREGAGWVSTAAGLGTQGDQGEQDVQTYY